jgi:hypothetical protein
VSPLPAALERELKQRARAYTQADTQVDQAKCELAISCAAAINAGASYRQLATLIDRPLGSVHKLVHLVPSRHAIAAHD